MADFLRSALDEDEGSLKLADGMPVVDLRDASPRQNASRVAAFVEQQQKCKKKNQSLAVLVTVSSEADEHLVVLFLMDDGDALWFDPNGDRTRVPVAFFDHLGEGLGCELVLPSRRGIQSLLKRDVCVLLSLFAVTEVWDGGRDRLDELMLASNDQRQRLELADFVRSIKSIVARAT
jgi:hypothetical protein